ncbi:putative E3 ubiquitin-protein ligase ARI8 [Nicotiana tabacum]|uniref:RBR-type E3 ubiquitin transferase n=1 Tax=Nicotiana tabacum TaxID=4097 RepID=A0A1S3YIL5_TOBAC|nr:PREDICTED: probable E3 ubiquitin-protein ligase ARI8 [Nicotiana tabacum]
MDSDYDIYDMDSEPEPEEEDFFSDEPIINSHNQKDYTILKDTDIHQLIKDDISKTTTILSVKRDVALALLRHYNWNMTKANEEWFANKLEVSKAIGMLLEKEETTSLDSNLVNCGICFEEYTVDKIAFAACKQHPFCKGCWECYISTSINDGPKCLVLRCPNPSCNMMVGESMIVKLASDKDKLKYYDYMFRSYVEENRKIKWCPAPGCEYAVEFEIGSENYDVICDCSNDFCWNCLDEIHRPIDCNTIEKWKNRNFEEAANTKWILAFTKKCPQCNKSIEKNKGCMHMTCVCYYQFCWLCLAKWDSCIGGCNGFEENKEVKEAKKNILRYTHYYERWVSNEKSKQQALKDLNEMRNEGVKKLSELHSLPETELEFIIQAWQQIVECRRVLKWSYAYGFYLPEEDKVKTQFFEYLQGEAGADLERLHHCAEQELLDHLGSTKKLDYTEQGSYKNYERFRSKLIGLTKVTGNYFEKLVTALENGLKDVNSKEYKRKREIPMSNITVDDSSMWACDRCSFLNADYYTVCQMCVVD